MGEIDLKLKDLEFSLPNTRTADTREYHIIRERIQSWDSPVVGILFEQGGLPNSAWTRDIIINDKKFGPGSFSCSRQIMPKGLYF